MKKRIFTLLLASLVCLQISACGKKDDEQNDIQGDDVTDVVETTGDIENNEAETDVEPETEKQPEIEAEPEQPAVVNPEVAETNTAKVEEEALSGDCYMAIELINKDENGNALANMKCDYAVSEDSNYIRIVMEQPVMDISMIVTPEKQYTVDNYSKMYMEGISDSLSSITSVIGRIKIGKLYDEQQDFETGTMEYDGVTYNYELFNEESQSSKYLFDDENNLKYVIFEFDGIETVVKIAELSSELPENIFEIPDGYEELKVDEASE